MISIRPIYAILLALSALVTGALGAMTLFAPERTASGFGVALTDDPGVGLLMAVLGGAIVSLALFVLLAAWWVWRNRSEGRTLGLLCAATLILVAITAYAFGSSTQVLVLDGSRGLILLVVGWFFRPESS